jgi:hypothetical protein
MTVGATTLCIMALSIPMLKSYKRIDYNHGQTSANRTKPGPSFQLQKLLCVCAMQLSCFETKLPNLMLKTRPKQLLGSLPLDIALPVMTY